MQSQQKTPGTSDDGQAADVNKAVPVLRRGTATFAAEQRERAPKGAKNGLNVFGFVVPCPLF